MLTAILKGKAGRINIDGQDQSWREVFRQREDLLTAVFFGRLPYLSIEKFTQVLSLLIGQDNAKNLPKLSNIEFWPKLTKVDEGKFVEPDIVLYFESTVIIIEVKPPFGGVQNNNQWTRQITAITKEEYSKIHFVALGKNYKDAAKHAVVLENQMAEYSLSIHLCEWHDVVNGISKLFDQSDNCPDQRILKDMLAAFDLFNMVIRDLSFEQIIPLLHIKSNWKDSFTPLKQPQPIDKKQLVDWLKMIDHFKLRSFKVIIPTIFTPISKTQVNVVNWSPLVELAKKQKFNTRTLV